MKNKLTADELANTVINRIEVINEDNDEETLIIFLAGAGVMLILVIMVSSVCYCLLKRRLQGVKNKV